MIMFDIDDIPEKDIFPIDYGGHGGRKLSVRMLDSDWMIKISPPIRNDGSLIYATSAVSEWLGSNIYKLCGLPAHETMLGNVENHLAVACRHIYEIDEDLLHFRDFMRAWSKKGSPEIKYSDYELEIRDVLAIIQSRKDLLEIDMGKRFWQMMVVDAFIGNSDRNATNWGVIRNRCNGRLRLAPIYDNGASFFSNRTENSCAEILGNPDLIERAALHVPSPFLLDGRKIDLMQWLINPPPEFAQDMISAANEIAAEINIDECLDLVDFSIKEEIMPPKKGELCKNMLLIRYEDIIRPLTQKFPIFHM